MAEQRQKNREMLTELVEASKAFLVDDICEPVDEVLQCVHCGATVTQEHNPELQLSLKHYSSCRAERLRKAIASANSVLGK